MDVAVGSRVRIRVSGRRRKGFVTAVFEEDPNRKLLPIDGVSGSYPSFDTSMLDTLRWAASYYVAPLSTLLRRTVPPNVPGSGKTPADDLAGYPADEATRCDLVYRTGAPPYGPAVAESLAGHANAGRTAVVIAPTVVEINDIAEYLEQEYPGRVALATSAMSAADVTEAWVRVVSVPGTILVGTREVMFWPFASLGIAVVVEDGRRVMRSPATPTVSVREVLIRRGGRECFPVVFHGPVPTLESVAHGVAMARQPGRQWPLIEVVDRNEEPPSGSLFTQHAITAIGAAVRSGESVFVLATSRGYAPAFRCVACGEIRRCPVCGSAIDRDGVCRRCGANAGSCANCGTERFQALGAGIGRLIDDISRHLESQVGAAGEDKPVTVGSERDLIGIHGLGLAVAVDIDGMIMAPHYRAAEDALRLLVRLAQTVRRGSGMRCLVQTSLPSQRVVSTLVEGNAESFLADELAIRAEHGFPPRGGLIAVETTATEGTHDLIAGAVGPHATILGPAEVKHRQRWLIQGKDLTRAKLALRPVLATLRGKGGKVRVDVDPIDL